MDPTLNYFFPKTMSKAISTILQIIISHKW